MTGSTLLTKKLFAKVIVTIGRGKGYTSQKQEIYGVFILLDGSIVIPHLFEYETTLCSFAVNTQETFETLQEVLTRIAPLKEFNGSKKVLSVDVYQLEYVGDSHESTFLSDDTAAFIGALGKDGVSLVAKCSRGGFNQTISVDVLFEHMYQLTAARLKSEGLIQ